MKIKLFLFYVLLMILVPICAIFIFSPYIKNYDKDIFVSEDIRIYNEKENKVISMPLEEYVLCVVASEMPISFEYDALCAQAIASRSFAVEKMILSKEKGYTYDVTSSYINDQAFSSYDSLKMKWKDNYKQNIEKLNKVIKETYGLVMTHKGKVISAYFHSTSSGKTQNSGAVWAKDMPYLKSAVSDESLSPKKHTTKQFTYEEVKRILKIDSIEDVTKIKIIEKNNADYVKSIDVLGTMYTGGEFRSMFKLDSASFDITLNDNEKIMIFDIKGFGHGVGMSQYGANKMALDGYKYYEILRHYYNDIMIKEIES